jgi:hypothetical protein
MDAGSRRPFPVVLLAVLSSLSLSAGCGSEPYATSDAAAGDRDRPWKVSELEAFLGSASRSLPEGENGA